MDIYSIRYRYIDGKEKFLYCSINNLEEEVAKLSVNKEVCYIETGKILDIVKNTSMSK